jgi:hypothetical protein
LQSPQKNRAGKQIAPLTADGLIFACSIFFENFCQAWFLKEM